MKHLLYIFLALLPMIAPAQDTTTGPPVYTFPHFPGGQQALVEYLSDNVQYPEKAIQDSIEGRVVCKFSIQADLFPSNIRITRSSGYALLDEEALRVIRSMPQWECESDTSEHNFQPDFTYEYTLPINFELH